MAPKNLTDRLLELLQRTSPVSRDDAAAELRVAPKSLSIPLSTLVKLRQVETFPDGTLSMVADPPTVVDLVRAAVARSKTCQVRPFASGIIGCDVPLKSRLIEQALEELVTAGELAVEHVEEEEDEDGYYSGRNYRRYVTPAAQAILDQSRRDAERLEEQQRQQAEHESRRSDLVNAMLRVVWPDGLDVDDVSRAGALRADLTRLVTKHEL